MVIVDLLSSTAKPIDLGRGLNLLPLVQKASDKPTMPPCWLKEE
ncbi:hypothetical protein TNCV_2191091, partial [Trichonephila clavipes]